MFDHIKFESLGKFDNEWLNARYHFSFADYYEPNRMGFGPLVVWNDDLIKPGTGFDPHGHRDMEIITYVREGAITHKDHLGNEGRTEAGDVQVMSAGKGIVHAEYNHEPQNTLLYQIWIKPAVNSVPPRWDARKFPKTERAGELVPLASGRSEHQDALMIHQDAAILGATLNIGQEVTHALGFSRRAYLVVAFGSAEVSDGSHSILLQERDGLRIWQVNQLKIKAIDKAEILLADLP